MTRDRFPRPCSDGDHAGPVIGRAPQSPDLIRSCRRCGWDFRSQSDDVGRTADEYSAAYPQHLYCNGACGVCAAWRMANNRLYEAAIGDAMSRMSVADPTDPDGLSPAGIEQYAVASVDDCEARP